MDRKVFPVVFDGHNDVLLRLGGPDGADPAHSSSAVRRVTWTCLGHERGDSVAIYVRGQSGIENLTSALQVEGAEGGVEGVGGE